MCHHLKRDPSPPGNPDCQKFKNLYIDIIKNIFFKIPKIKIPTLKYIISNRISSVVYDKIIQRKFKKTIKRIIIKFKY